MPWRLVRSGGTFLQLKALLSSARAGKIFQLHASAVLPKGKQPYLPTHLIGAWVSLSAGIDAVAPLFL